MAANRPTKCSSPCRPQPDAPVIRPSMVRRARRQSLRRRAFSLRGPTGRSLRRYRGGLKSRGRGFERHPTHCAPAASRSQSAGMFESHRRRWDRVGRIIARSPGGGTGRRAGLRNPCPSGVGVRLSPRRLIDFESLSLQAGRCPAGFHKPGAPGSLPGPGTLNGTECNGREPDTVGRASLLMSAPSRA